MNAEQATRQTLHRHSCCNMEMLKKQELKRMDNYSLSKLIIIIIIISSRSFDFLKSFQLTLFTHPYPHYSALTPCLHCLDGSLLFALPSISPNKIFLITTLSSITVPISTELRSSDSYYHPPSCPRYQPFLIRQHVPACSSRSTFQRLLLLLCVCPSARCSRVKITNHRLSELIDILVIFSLT